MMTRNRTAPRPSADPRQAKRRPAADKVKAVRDGLAAFDARLSGGTEEPIIDDYLVALGRAVRRMVVAGL